MTRLNEGSALGWNDYSTSQRKLFVAGMRSMTHHKFIDGWRLIKRRISTLKESKLRLSKYRIPQTDQETELVAVEFPSSPSFGSNSIDLRCFFIPYKKVQLEDNDRRAELNITIIEMPSSGVKNEQSTLKERTERLLNRSLSHLACSNVSLMELTDTLSSKAGLKFVLNKGIRDHIFSLQTDGKTIEETLGMLCRINHWRRSVLEDGSIYIAWQFLRKNRMEVQEDIRALREGAIASLPPSLASFLGIGINGDEIVPPFVVPEEQKNQFFPVLEPPKRQRATGVVSARGVASGIGETSLQTLKWGEIPQEFNGQPETPYNRWSSRTRRTVCEFIVSSQ